MGLSGLRGSQEGWRRVSVKVEGLTVFGVPN